MILCVKSNLILEENKAAFSREGYLKRHTEMYMSDTLFSILTRVIELEAII